MIEWAESLKELNACREAVEWAKDYPTLQKAWTACERGDWMLWFVGKLSGDKESDSRKKLVLCACACARLALKHIPKGEKRPRKTIETAEKWARDEAGITLDDVRIAYAYAYATTTAAAAAAADAADAADAAAADAADAAAAAAAAADAAAAAAADAADAAADAADAADAAAAAAAATAAAAAAAADAAADAAAYDAYDARKNTLKKCAEIVRQYYPKAPTK